MAFQKKEKHASGKIPELGAIFMANRATKKMCFSWKTFGLPFYKAGFVRQVKAGMFLFLFEYETRKLYGVYQACCNGDMNLSSEAFSSTGSKYPAQVQFRVIWYCKPLSEDEFRPAIKDNYFAAYKFNFGLSKNQVKKLLWLFNSRKLRDELLQEQMLPSDPSLIRATPRSCSIDDVGEEFTFRAQNEYVPENTNDHQLNKDLDNFIMPNRKVHGRLLIDADRDIGHEDADPVLPFRDGVTQVRDTRDYGCNSKNDNELNSEVPYVSSVEKYDPDIPLFAHMPATQQLPEYHDGDGHMWDGRVYADNSVDGRPLIKQGELQNFTRYFEPIISNSSSPHLAHLDNAVGEGPSSYNPDLGTSLQGRERYPKVHLNPDFFRGLDSCINVEHLKPLSDNMLLPSETDDDASISRQPVAYYDPSQTISHPIPSRQFQSSVGIESFGTKRYEDALLHSSACGRTHEMETIVPSFCMKDIRNPVDTNQYSKVCEERQPVSQNKRSVFSRLKPALDADDESKLKDSAKSIDDMVNEAMEMLNGHYRQLLKKSCSMTKQVDDDENLSKMKEHQTFHSQAAKYESVAPVEMVSDLPTANEEFESESQIIEEMPLLNFKRRSEVQKTRDAAEGCLGEMSSAILAEKQSKRRKLVRPSLSEKEWSDDNAVLDNISLNITLSCQPILSRSLNTDARLPCDKEQKPPVAGNLGSGVLAASVGDECRSGLTGSNNLTDGSKQSTSNWEEDQRAETSTKMELLGVSLNDADLFVDAAVRDQKQKIVSVTGSANTGSDKSVGMDGSQQELHTDLDMNTTHFFPVKNEDLEDPTMARGEVHVESTSNNLLAEGTSASGQATQVQYFEFFK